MSQTEMLAFAGAHGLLRFVYHDELVELLTLGSHSIARASQVEPTPEGWLADLGPSGGPVLGPFRLRSDAIKAEVNWINDQSTGGVYR